MERTFEYNEATRQRVPLLLGLVGPSGSGKTFSALRLAKGIQRVTGGDVAVVDTESKRALHYADQFTFRHIPFDPPHSPLDYMAAVEHCVKQGATTMVIDSSSHEHEGMGGVLEWHQAELDRLSGGDFNKAKKMQMLAWAKPKAARRKLINRLLQLPINVIFCFRAKQKLKIVPGKEPEELGWSPIAGEEFIYEMTANFLLYPKSGGVPTWASDMPGERAAIKLPRQFVTTFESVSPLSEEHGQQMAEWAAGDTRIGDVAQSIIDGFDVADRDSFKTISEAMRRDWKKMSPTDQKAATKARDEAKERIAASLKDAPSTDDPERAAIQEAG